MISLSLTDRQREVAELVANGNGYKAIASILGISRHTAKAHVTTIADRLPSDGLPPLRRVMRWMLHRAA